MAQRRLAISKRVEPKHVVYVLRSESSGEATEHVTIQKLAEAVREQRRQLPQVDFLIRADVPHDIEWRAGSVAPHRYVRLYTEEVEELCALLGL